MAETSGLDLVWLQKRAELCGCHCNRHKIADACGGDLYVMARKTHKGEKPPSLITYATVEEVEALLTRVEEENLRLKRRA